MQKIVRRFSDRITTQHDVDNSLLRGSNPNFLRTWSLRRKPKSPSFRESTSASSFIDPGHPPPHVRTDPRDSLPPRTDPRDSLLDLADTNPRLPLTGPLNLPVSSTWNLLISAVSVATNIWITETELCPKGETVHTDCLQSSQCYHMIRNSMTQWKRVFKTNFLCLKTEKQALNEQPEYPTVVSMISCLVLTSLRSRFLQGVCKR